MSWMRRIESDAEGVIKKIEEDSAYVYGEIAQHVSAFEKEFVARLKNAFGALEGERLVVTVNSDGHFDDDGTGMAVISIKAVAADVPPAEQTAEPPAAEPAPESQGA